MARLSDEGHKVYKLTIANNETRFDQKNIEVNYEASAKQSVEACRKLGVEEVAFEPVECSHLFYSTETKQRIEKIVYELEIDTAFIHFHSDMNQDHYGVSIRENVSIGRNCIIERNSTINYGTMIGNYVKIMDLTHIHDYVFIAPHVSSADDNTFGKDGYDADDVLGAEIFENVSLGEGVDYCPR